ncbi:MAG TPA: hypothetical protein VMV58_04685 [Desulfosporosinus sp.]|nr:hypothetical protein [Desulfosporosinus sp.]
MANTFNQGLSTQIKDLTDILQQEHLGIASLHVALAHLEKVTVTCQHQKKTLILSIVTLNNNQALPKLILLSLRIKAMGLKIYSVFLLRDLHHLGPQFHPGEISAWYINLFLMLGSSIFNPVVLSWIGKEMIYLKD